MMAIQVTQLTVMTRPAIAPWSAAFARKFLIGGFPRWSCAPRLVQVNDLVYEKSISEIVYLGEDFAMSERSAKSSKMGRPPLHVRPIVVRLSVEMLGRIEMVAGKRRIAAFLREAAEAELLRRGAGKPTTKPKKGKP
jgi:hypothetical protein